MKSLMLSLLLLPLLALAETSAIDVWLVHDQQPLPLPVFGDRNDNAALLDAVELNIPALRPMVYEVWESVYAGWQTVREKNLRINPTLTPYVQLAGGYLQSAAWQKGTLTLTADVPLQVYLNGEMLGQCTTAKDGQYTVSKETTLPRGKHTIIAKMVAPNGQGINLSGKWDGARVTFTEDGNYSFANFEDMTLFDDVSSPCYSSNGNYVAYIHSSYNHTHKKESWLEVMDIATQVPVYTLRPVKGVGNIGWLPSKTTALYYTTSGSDGDDIWTLGFPAAQPRCEKRNVKGLVKLVGGSSHPVLYYTADAELEESDHDWTLWNTLEDRMDDWTPRRALFALNMLSGETRQLTAMADSFALDDFAVSPTEAYILFTRRIPQVERPYYRTEFWLYDTIKGTARLVLTQLLPFETRPLSFTWTEGEYVAYVTAAYETLPDDTLDRNSTQTAVWLLNTRTGESKPLTLGAHYAVDEDEGSGALRWNPRDKKLYMRVVRGCEIQIMKLDPFAENPQAEPVQLSRTVVGDFDMSFDGRIALIASDPLHPNALIEYNPESFGEAVRFDPNQRLLTECELPKWESWNFENSLGDTIEGFIYYPPDYQPELSRSWPLIVYYYGGVSPRDLRFRYTYLWWAANGYVVYVLNPSGTIGYAPAFADRHSNDWGTITSQDIIEGTRKLLNEKKFLDPQRVGAYGGSYGGFLTMDLATKTELFAALCSMSGISNITSYFGVGTWGFTYGDIALPRSFPWNRRDVFVDKSPIFNADKVKTPLLLTHGIADVNVPVGESDQMFVALKLLGKDVAEVRFKGEDHIFSTFDNRVVEMNVLLEWFDKYLKGEPQAWEARWGKK